MASFAPPLDPPLGKGIVCCCFTFFAGTGEAASYGYDGVDSHICPCVIFRTMR
jgi:hypothetical protein